MKNQRKREHSLELELLLHRKWKELCFIWEAPVLSNSKAVAASKRFPAEWQTPFWGILMGMKMKALLDLITGSCTWQPFKGPFIPFGGTCRFSKMQLGRNVKQNHEALCLLLSSSKALSYPSLLRRLKMFKFWGPNKLELTIWQWHLQNCSGLNNPTKISTS